MEVPLKTKIITATKRAMITTFLTGTKLLVLNVLPRKPKLNQDHFLTMIAPELSDENPDAKGKVHKNQLAVHTDKSFAVMSAKFESISPGKQR
jgi:hypothetical protein